MAAVVLVVLGLSGCSSEVPWTVPTSAGPSAPVSADSGVTLTVDLYHAGGLEPLLEGYAQANPGVTIEVRRPDPASSSLPRLLDDLDGAADLPDVVGFTDPDLGAILARSDALVDLATTSLSQREPEFVPWAWARATTADGALVAVPASLHPQAVCFRSDLLSDAGIATDRDELARLLAADGGGWETYFDLGRQYRQLTGHAWFDQPYFLWDEMVKQLDEGYTDAEGSLVAETNADLRARWDLLTAALSDGLSAEEVPWDWDGSAAFVDGSFATLPCTPAMATIIRDNVVAAGGDAATGWDVAPVFPGGGGSWGSSYLAVPVTSEHPEAAADLLDWMTQPERQAEAFTLESGLPSTRQGLDAVAAAGEPDPFFHGAPLAAVFAQVATDVPPHVDTLDEWWVSAQAFGPALDALQQEATTPDDAWSSAVVALQDLVPARS